MPRRSPVQQRSKMRGGRLTIGMLTSQLNRGFHRAALMGVAEAARRSGAKLICFEGGILSPPGSPYAAANVLYELVSAEAVNGLVIWSSALDWIVDEAQTEAFCRRFAPLPVVSVGRAFSGVPSVLVDNYQGMRDAVYHLIHHHGLKRIAFLRGPEGAREEELRYRAYCDALAAHDIPLSPELVYGRTNWERSDGIAAIHEFLDVRGLRPGRDFQAAISVGDDMACGALEALQARDVRVPDEVAIIGFNDDDEGRAILPALTTVRQPVEEMTRQAVATLVGLFRGEPAPEVSTLPLELIVRRSCGCLSPGVIQAVAQRPLAPRADREMLIAEMARAAGSDTASAACLLDDFQAELSGTSSGDFLVTLNAILQRETLAERDASLWHQALSILRGELLPDLAATQARTAEDLWQQGRVLVSETAAQARAYQRFRAEQDTRVLGDFIQRIQTASDRDTLFGTLATELPELGVSACYLALYKNPREPAGRAQLLFGVNADGRVALVEEGLSYPSRRLLPQRLLAGDDPYSLVVLPLYFQDRQLGFMILAVDARGAAFSETLREQISVALAGLFLREEIREAWQRAEEANRLKSRFLATVSHELRTPLSLIVGTIEMMQRESVAAGLPLPGPFRKDLDSIHASAQHLARLIGDVLDLASSQAGELRLSCEPLHLEEVLAKVAMLGEPLAREKNLGWHIDIPSDLPTVWGDRTRLQQVALNLVSNAVKFTPRGNISLWVEAGKTEIVVAVSDTGMGIAPDEQETIFNEFRQSERAARRGYGGMGLGLAISKRIVELHGGRIGVLSSGSDGAGSTFYFTLPVRPWAVNADREPGDRSGSVLILSEQAGDARRLATHLVDLGFLVETLATAEHPDWLAQIIAAPPGAVVLDYEPAAERGWELMHLLKLNPATQDVPVVFYSLQDGPGSGAVLTLDYLGKPIANEALCRALALQGVACGRGKDTSILVVDDDPAILALHSRIVQANVPGSRVLRASNGVEALAVMSMERPALVLLDLMMPEMDGFMVLEKMREDASLRRTPVIVLTAQILTHEDMARLQKGVAAVLGKELFTEAEVLDQIAATLACNKRLGSEAQQVARQAMAFIHEHYDQPISRGDIARQLAVNERHLTRCFREETGVTPVDYLTRYRIARARVLLEQSSLSVTEVALATGFSDGSYFSRVFQKEVGVAPSAYRRRERPLAADP